ncbi:MAG: RIO1 family regulatory kinase/ATPase, partial [Ignisphaera sp.]
HGDMSEYNIMVFMGEPYIIDVSQAVKVDHPNAIQFLYRDIHNIVRFFSNEVGIEVPPAKDILELIIEKKLNQDQLQ